jgi:hypothetical protein
MKLFIAAILLWASVASAQVCKPGQYDMLTWMAPSIGVVNSHFDVLYPSTGTFYWVKGKAGYPWDERLFDTAGVYDWRTEKTWVDPTTYKEFETPPMWAHRCLNPGVAGQRLDQVLHDKSTLWYQTHTSCTSFTRQNLSYGLNEVWDSGTLTIGKLPPAHTLSLVWAYGCTSAYASCRYREVFDLQNGPGLARWSYYIRQANGTYSLANQTFDDTPQAGTVQPVHPCW